MGASRTERLRQAVAEAADERGRLAAMAALARHFAEVSDGVNGLAAARDARALALRLQDWDTVAHALNSASLSQYHRSDYAGALATAIDAWDAARRAGSHRGLADSLFTIALALHSLGEDEMGLRLVDEGLEIIEQAPELREAQVQLVGLKALLLFRGGDLEEVEAHCARHVELAKDVSTHLLELGHGNWGFALLRTAELRIAAGAPSAGLLARAREHFDAALALATAGQDELRVADRMSGLGQVAFLEARFDEAERLLSEAMRRSLELDYVRTAVISARYLAQLHVAGNDLDRAIDVLRVADAKARRGAPADSRPAVKVMLAGLLERVGQGLEAERLREAARELRSANEEHRSLAVDEARKLATRVLAELG